MKPLSQTSTSIIFFFLVLVGLTNCQQKTQENEEDPVTQIIEIQIDSLLSEPEFKALSMAVWTNGKVHTFHKGQLADGKVPNDQTLYEIASLTKTFTGTLLAQAIHDKKVAIDDDIRTVLTDSLPNLEYEGQPITFRHLVTHTSRLPDMFPHQPEIFNNPDFDKLPFVINDLQKNFTKEQFFSELQKVTLDTLSGHQFKYSNAGANLLGYCLEEIYGKPYEELLKQYIFEPLQMTNTAIQLSEEQQKHLAQGFNHNGKEMPFYTNKQMNAEGGIKSTLDDMVKYMQFHADTTNAIVKISHQELWNGKYGDYESGLFWQIFKDGDKPDQFFQNGGAFGTSSWMTIVPELQTGVYAVTNVSGPNVHQKMSDRVKMIFETLKNK
ncbi:MAG: serine hydrolase domain-containing protein [Chitinophagales bacterium]